MSTLRQIEANRRNAQKSTGPTSATGKAASSMNALKTGLHAKALLLPDEKLADLQLLIDEYYQSHHPSTPEARCLLDDLIRCEWILRRFDRVEAQMWPYQQQDSYRVEEDYPLGKSASQNASTFSKLQYRADATRRARDRALKSLQQLEAQSAPAPDPAAIPSSQIPSPQIGFVPPLPSGGPHAPVDPPDCDSVPADAPQNFTADLSRGGVRLPCAGGRTRDRYPSAHHLQRTNR